MEVIRKFIALLIGKLHNLEFELYNLNQSLLGNMYLKLNRVNFGRGTSLGRDIYIKRSGNITLGDNCSIGSFSKFWNYDSINIGDDFLGAGCLTINNGTHDISNLSSSKAPIVIGKRVWCGINVTILGGIVIGDDVSIGANSLVNKDIPSNSVAVGNPIRVIKKNVRVNSLKE